MNIIRLHSYDDNTIVLLNDKNIMGIDTMVSDEGKVYSAIHLSGVDSAINVNETPEKIYKILLKSKTLSVIKLHNSETNHVIVINTEDIVGILTINDPEHTYGIIYTHTFDNGIIVNETPDKIYNMLDNNK